MPRYTNADLHEQIKDLRHDLERELRKIGRHIMALTTAELAAFAAITAKIDAAFTAATSGQQVLRDQIAALTTTIDQMVADDTQEDAAFTQQLVDLAAARDALQAQLDSQETDVLGALSSLGDHVSTLGGTPPTP